MKLLVKGALSGRSFLDPVVKVSSFSGITVIMDPVYSCARVDAKGHRAA